MRRVRILEEAADEAIAAAAWYDQEKPGLGAEFEQALDAALDLLEEDLAPSVPVPGVTGTRGVSDFFYDDSPIRLWYVNRAPST